MPEAQEGFNLTVWLAKLTMREWVFFACLVLILAGPGLLGRSKAAPPPTPPAPPEPEPVGIPAPKKKPLRRIKR
jgi:hypothetical protein